MSSVRSNYVLKSTDVTNLLKCLTSISFKWKELGVALNLPLSLRQKYNHLEHILALENIILEWVNGQGLQPPSLDQLEKALASDIVGHKRLASNLIPEFNKVLVDKASSSLPEDSHSGELHAAVELIR